MKTKIIGAIVLLLGIVSFVVYSKAVKAVPQDGADAKMTRFDNLRDMRYAEVFLIGGNGITKNLQAAFDNSTNLNNSADPRHTFPQALWDKVDAEALKEQFD